MEDFVDYVEDERRRKISDSQPNWMAAIGICIIGASALGVVWLVCKIIAKAIQ